MNKKTLNTIGISLLFLIIGLVAIKYFNDKKKLENEHRITIGRIDWFVIGAKSGYILDYSFSVDSQKYKCDVVVYDNPKNLVNKNFFVAFSPSNPKNSKILLTKPVPKQIDKAPLNGWKEIPQ